MGKAHILQSNFSGGEMDPKRKGQVDLPRYHSSLATCRNFYLFVGGGGTRRAGLKFIEDEGAGTVTRLIPFTVFKKEVSPAVLQGYIVEFKDDNTIDFYTNGAKLAASITSPFTDADLGKIRYEQFDNALYLVHPDFPPQKLTRTNDTTWAISALSFTHSKPLAKTATLSKLECVTTTNQRWDNSSDTYSYTAAYTAVARTATPHGFRSGQILEIAGATPTGFNGFHRVKVRDSKTFEYPLVAVLATPATGTVTATASLAITRSGTTATVSMDDPHGLKTGQAIKVSGATQTEYNIEAVITVTDESTFTYTVSGAPATPATGPIRAERLLWSATAATGYPSAICFFEQRMILAATKTNPQTIWGSETGDITNLASDTGDSDPFEYVLSGATSNIYHLAALKQIYILTYDREFMLQGGVEKPLTPTNLQIKEMTGYGAREKVRPLFVGNEFLFATRHGKKLRASAYRYDSDSWAAPDMSLWSAHLADLGIVEMVHQKEPVSIIWIVTVDGRLLSVTYDKDQEVVAWSQHTTDGLFKSVAVIPYNDTDQVWVAVERTIGATARTFIEVFDSALNTDSCVTGTDGPGKATWTGLSHLNGKTVDILADGVVMPPQVVASGQITLPRNANAVEIGLHFTSTLTDLPPEIPTAIGTAQGQAISVNKCIVRLHESVGCTVNGEVVPFRQFGAGVLDTPIAPFSGDKAVNMLGWASKGVVTIEQTQPLPLTVLAIVKEVTVNG